MSSFCPLSRAYPHMVQAPNPENLNPSLNHLNQPGYQNQQGYPNQQQGYTSPRFQSPNHLISQFPPNSFLANIGQQNPIQNAIHNTIQNTRSYEKLEIEKQQIPDQQVQIPQIEEHIAEQESEDTVWRKKIEIWMEQLAKEVSENNKKIDLMKMQSTYPDKGVANPEPKTVGSVLHSIFKPKAASEESFWSVANLVKWILLIFIIILLIFGIEKLQKIFTHKSH